MGPDPALGNGYSLQGGKDHSQLGATASLEPQPGSAAAGTDEWCQQLWLLFVSQSPSQQMLLGCQPGRCLWAWELPPSCQTPARRSLFQPRCWVSSAALDAAVCFHDAVLPSDLALQPGNLSSCLRQQSREQEKLGLKLEKMPDGRVTGVPSGHLTDWGPTGAAAQDALCPFSTP